MTFIYSSIVTCYKVHFDIHYAFICFEQGYSPEMLARLHETSKHSAERQLYTLMYELLAQKSIVANDVITRTTEIMTGSYNEINHTLFIVADEKDDSINYQIFCFISDLGNPNSVTSKALHVLPTLKFEF